MNTPLRTLLVEDSEDDALLVIRELQRGGYAPEFKIVETAEALEAAIEDQAWDIILSDYSLPRFSGAAALNIVKNRCPDLPFIIVSGTIGEKTAVEVMRKGAHDFLLKDNLALLPPAVGRELEQARNRKAYRNARKALRKEELKYGSLIQTLTDLVFIVNIDGRIEFLNSEFENLTGHCVQNFIGRSFTEMLFPDHRARALEYFQRGLSGEKIPLCEVDIKTRDGNRVPMELKGTAIRDDEGQVIGRIGLARNIRNRKLAEEALKESEKRYRSMMESMKEPVYICSADHLVEYMNPAMIKRTGQDATGFLCFKAVHDLDEICPWCKTDKATANGDLESDIVSPKDNRSYHVSQSPIAHRDGSVSLMTVLRDTTRMKRLEAQLQQAQKMESIGTLAGGIAHDFNNILFPIIGYAEMLLDDIPDGSPLRNGVKEIYGGAMRARELIKQILTFSRQDSEGVKLLKMQPIVKDALKLIRATISTEIDIHQDIRADCGIVEADPTHIHQIVMNLATNAYHAMEDTGGTLRVNLKEIRLDGSGPAELEMLPGKYACLTVADTGTGIDRGVKEKIFEPFFTTKKKGKGTGMGLSVVHGIVKSAGGIIDVQTELGKGTQFYVYLPVVKSGFEEPAGTIQKPIQGGREQILLVDDENAIVTMEKIMLERLGYRVVTCVDSMDALEIFRGAPDRFDMVITDMSMPGMSGAKLAEKIFAIRPGIPVLLCTGFNDPIKRERIDRIGIKGVLMKPVDRAQMAGAIRGLLKEPVFPGRQR